MPERQSHHPDNDLIDEMQQEPTPSQGSSSGGNVSRKVGKRDERKRATDPDNREPVVGSDNPEDDEERGEKTQRAMNKSASD